MAVEGAELAMLSVPRPQNSADISAERRREKDRLRKQAARDSPQNSADVRGNPQNSENASLSKKEKKEDGKKEREATRRNSADVRGHRLPDGWQPPPQDWAVADELIGRNRAQSELEKFRDHWKQQLGSRGVKLDWSAAWRNWIRRAAEYTGAKNGRRTVHDAAHDLLAKVRALDEPAPGGLRDGEGEGAVRLLPPRGRE